jgi:hypothetical protein
MLSVKGMGNSLPMRLASLAVDVLVVSMLESIMTHTLQD